MYYFFCPDSVMAFFFALFPRVQTNKRNERERITFICTSKKSSPSSLKLSSRSLIFFSNENRWLSRPIFWFCCCALIPKLYPRPFGMYMVHVKCWPYIVHTILLTLRTLNLAKFSASTFFTGHFIRCCFFAFVLCGNVVLQLLNRDTKRPIKKA